MSYDNGGGFSEWFDAGPLGIEQGFTVGRSGARSAGVLIIPVGRVPAGATVRLSVNRRGLLLGRDGRVVLRYVDLAARDSAGRSLPARLLLRGRSIAIAVQARAARYPVTVDPLIQSARLTASDASQSAQFGESVAISGNTIVVGAPAATVGGVGGAGAVYVFTEPAAGWASATETARLTASDGAAGYRLGTSVAIDGGTIVAGAPGALVGSSATGAAYVFVEPPVGWASATQTAKLTPSNVEDGERAGVSVGISGSTIVAGASEATVAGAGGAGAAYVFTKPGGGWVSEAASARLTASNPVSGTLLGYSVAVDGGTIAAGAPNFEDANPAAGAVYEYSEPQVGWTNATETAQLTSSDSAAGAQLGTSVAVSGTTIVGGAPYATVSNTTEAGAAYVFTEPPGGWSSGHEQAVLTAALPATFDLLGYRVAVTGATIVAGAPGPAPGTGPGSVLVFSEPGGGWASTTESQRLTASDASSGDQVGSAVGVSGSTVVAGAQEATVSGNSQAGAAYVFTTPSEHQLTVTVTVIGSGSVAGGGISCPGACTAAYSAGASVTLTATPAAGAMFTGWSGACAAAGVAPTCQLTVGADLTAGASFTTAGTQSPAPQPPTVLTAPRVTGTPKAGMTLSCSGDTYSGLGSPSIVTATWFDMERVNRFAVYTTTEIGTGRSLVLGDLDPGASIFCETTATTAAGASVTATSASVTMQASIPALASPQFKLNHNTAPTIDSTVAPGGLNTCTSGVWIHHPLTFAYAWYALPSPTAAIGPAYRVGTAATLKLTASMQDDIIVCQVTATNQAGSGTALSNRYLALEPDFGVHVNAIEVTQGVQTPELPARSGFDPSLNQVSYSGASISSQNPGDLPVTVKLAQDHATVVRVYVNTTLPLGSSAVPDVLLTAWRNGHELAPGAIGPDQLPPAGEAVRVGPLGGDSYMRNVQRVDPNGAYTFTLPWGWAEGDVTFTAIANPVSSRLVLTRGCDSACEERTLTLTGVHFNPVTQADIYPIAFLAGTHAPKGFTINDPEPDPAWSVVQSVVPFPIYIHPYVQVTGVASVLGTCDGVTQAAGQSNSAFAQAVYAQQNQDLRQDVADYGAANDRNVNDFLFGVVPAGVPTTCANAGGFSGGNTQGGVKLHSVQPLAVASDDRPLTAMAHEFHHGLGLVHAGVQCGSGTVGQAESQTASTTSGSNQLTSVASVTGLAPGQAITGPGLDSTKSYVIVSISGTTVTMNLKATATTTGATYAFAVEGNQVGEPWPPSFIASTGVPADGLFDGIGLEGLEDPTNSPYKIIGPAVAGTAGSEIYDLMSYCGGESSAWISVKNWNRDVEFAAPATASAAARVGPLVRAAAQRLKASSIANPHTINPPATSAAIRSLAVTAVYDPLTGRTLSLHVTPDSATAPARPGASVYSLVAESASGTKLAAVAASPSQLHVDGSNNLIVVTGIVPAKGTRAIELLQYGSPIGRLTATPNAPAVSILSPANGARLGGPGGAVLRWRSHDPDGGGLQATVRYSTDDGRHWRTIYSGADASSVRLPSFLLSASHHARIRLYVSDGFNTTIATSAEFTATGAPPLVSITSPTRSTRLAAGAPLNLAGVAYDDTGARLTGRALTWMIGRHRLGSGAQLSTIEVPAGRHTIRLVARDRAGRTARASVTVTILPVRPVISRLSAPARLSPKARSVSLRLSLLAPAQLSVGRVHATIGRTLRTIRIPVARGKQRLVIVLRLRSGRYTTRFPVVISR